MVKTPRPTKAKPGRKVEPPERLRRYTSLGALIHMLTIRKLTLLNPATWDDKNDTYFMSEYKRLMGAKTLLALCFAMGDETYHHWRVFSSGPDGVCIEFNKDKLLAHLAAQPGVTTRMVDYKTIKTLRGKPIPVTDLPFLKRKPYIDECEHRVIFLDTDTAVEFKDIDIDLNWIDRITLSPWISPALRKSVEQALQAINAKAGDAPKLKIYRSTLTGNSEWQALTENITGVPAKLATEAEGTAK